MAFNSLVLPTATPAGEGVMAIEVTFWGSSLSFLQEEIRRRAMNTRSNFFQPFSESCHVKLNREGEKRSTDISRVNLEGGGGGRLFFVYGFIFKIMYKSMKKIKID